VVLTKHIDLRERAVQCSAVQSKIDLRERSQQQAERSI
jgi:hypothetical protein